MEEAKQLIICVYLALPTNEKSFLIARAFTIHHFTLKEFQPASALICVGQWGNMPGSASRTTGWGSGQTGARYVVNLLSVSCWPRGVSSTPSGSLLSLGHFRDLCKVSWHINCMVVGIIVPITHLRINLI